MNCFPRRLLAALLAFPLSGIWLAAQISQVLTVKTPAKATLARGGTASVTVAAGLRGGYHVNSNAPADDYMIPLRLTWDESLLKVQEVSYPKPESRKYSFSEKPILVYTGDFEIQTRFQAPAGAPIGMSVVTGKLRYQACNDSMCLPPKVVEVRLPVEIRAR